MVSKRINIRLTWLLFFTFNVLALGCGVITYKVISSRTNTLFREGDQSANQEKLRLIAQSTRQSILVNDNVALRSMFQSALDDPSIKFIRFIPADEREGICVSRANECYSPEITQADLTMSDLFFGPDNGQRLGSLVIRFENIKAIELNQIISRYVGFTVLVVLLFVNVFVLTVIRAFRAQVSWSIEAVRSRSTDQPVALGHSLFVEQKEFASALEDLDDVLNNYRKRIENSIQQQALVTIARQVVHNIRSPLVALEVGLGTVGKDLPEESRILLRSATTRIMEIANGLLEKMRVQPKLDRLASDDTVNAEQHAVYLVSSLVDTLISEKRLQFRSRMGVEIQYVLTHGAYGLFANIQAIEFQSVLSNLINNGVEGLERTGVVKVKLYSDQDQIVVSVSDNGRGIPADRIPKLGGSGATFEKVGGSGIGLFHARHCLHSWNGSLKLYSEIGKGTTVECRIPVASPPVWFVPELSVANGTAVVILDDDHSIHQVWKSRFALSSVGNRSAKLFHFTTTEETVRWSTERLSSSDGIGDVLYLFDYELLGESITGLELIERLGIENEAILVTSRYEERGMIEEAQKLGVRFIPKGLVGIVPIRYRDELELFDAILIDDDDLIHRVWHLSARTSGKQIKTFETVDAFMHDAEKIDRRTHVYIDSSLGNGVVGEVAAKAIFDKGYRKISLVTGFEVEKFSSEAMPWIKTISGKNPPWEQAV